jgi:hypothetical protein
MTSLNDQALGTARSIIDPVSNVVLLAGLSIESDLARIVLGGRYPLGVLPSFTHEGAHHQQFDSAVGHVMSLLFFRAIEAAFALGHLEKPGG